MKKIISKRKINRITLINNEQLLFTITNENLKHNQRQKKLRQKIITTASTYNNPK